MPGLVSSQAQLCRSNLELMQTIIQAAREVKKVCQKTFGDMRWNCSSIDAPKFLPDLERGELLNESCPREICLGFVFIVWNVCTKYPANYLKIVKRPIHTEVTTHLFIPECGIHWGRNTAEKHV